MNKDEQNNISLTELERKILAEVKNDLQLSPSQNIDNLLINHIREGIVDINENNGFVTNYDEDIISRRLLKLYVIYAYYKRLAEFKNLYSGEYAERQRHYFQATHTDVQ